jgi:hypothetical protein
MEIRELMDHDEYRKQWTRLQELNRDLAEKEGAAQRR